MCDLGIKAENFNPHIYYAFKRKFDEKNVADYHSHDFPSVIYILSGGCVYHISGVNYQVRKGNVIVINPGIFHCKVMKPGDEIIELHMGFGNIFVDGLPRNYLLEPYACPVIDLREHEQDFAGCCCEICSEQEKNAPGGDLMLKIYVMKFLVLLLKATRTCRGQPENPPVSFESSEKSVIVDTLKNYMNENYMKQVSLDSISRSIYLSPAYISKVFREETGEPPINYLIKLRLAKARELLQEGTHSVKAVARSVGYEDVYYFSKLFKKYNKVSPSYVKKQSAHSRKQTSA